MPRAYVSRGWPTKLQEKKSPLEFNRNSGKTSKFSVQEKRRASESYGLAEIFKNVVNV